MTVQTITYRIRRIDLVLPKTVWEIICSEEHECSGRCKKIGPSNSINYRGLQAHHVGLEPEIR